jgi:dGTPase
MKQSLQSSSFASFPEHSRGRFYKEAETSGRTLFQRDRDRIIHSAAFRRLEYKTQVFVNHEGDHYRTRLTHSLEVAQIARSISRNLGLNEDLAEALALAHDLGHTPFGHAGEDALHEAMLPFGGFDHNAHTIKILTALEHRYAAFDGLNLTWETLEGIAKHNGPLTAKPIPTAIAEYNAIHDLELNTYASVEAQVAALADDIAYNNHDIEDGLRAGLFTTLELSTLPYVGKIFMDMAKDYPAISQQRLIHESIRRMIHGMVHDVLAQTLANISAFSVITADDARQLDRPVVCFSKEMEQNNLLLKQFLMENMYRHYKVNRMTSKARRVVSDLFALFLSEPECLSSEWRELSGAAGTQQTAVVVSDFIAGMTDRFALKEHRLLFDLSTHRN